MPSTRRSAGADGAPASGNDAQRSLVDRVRAALPAGSAVREIAMFGGRAVLLDGSILVSAGPQGDLLVRVDPDERDELLARPGAGPASMGQDRPMGERWLTVDHAALADDEALATWLGAALRQHRRALKARSDAVRAGRVTSRRPPRPPRLPSRPPPRTTTGRTA
jgi:TfoX/Sxy family transcriptional regulator of competence genes